MLISRGTAVIKSEVNLVKRGCYTPPTLLVLCEKAQEEFESFCEMPVVEKGLLYGGKICAALDRQHPRDLFDIKLLLENDSIDESIKKGFLFYMLSGGRPSYEILNPHLKDQRKAFENQFLGMTSLDFSYAEYEQVRTKLIAGVNNALSEKDKAFIISIEEGNPAWDIYDFKAYPALQWKLQNIELLKQQNPDKHKGIITHLKESLDF